MSVRLFLSLTLALGLPWLAGAMFLKGFASNFLRIDPHPLTRIGLGFFTGQLLLLAGLYLANGVGGGWSVWPPVLVLTAAGILGWAFNQRSNTASFSHQTVDDSFVPPGSTGGPGAFTRLATILMLGLCVMHLAFVAIEVFHRPVFPWDGWLNWMYRAKAWFYAGSWLSFDTPAMWLMGERSSEYAVAGRHYPPLLPVTAVWMALITGGWSETLINVPTLIAGIALTLAVYGMARDGKLPAWASALAAYLFLSLPLVGTHLSLAGMADIWMAGYAGLGFICLLLGLQLRETGWLILGLTLILLSRLVKLEGSVWLLAALLASASVLRPKWTLGALCIGAACIGAAALLGLHAVNIPLIGTLGIVDERLTVPFVGSYALADWQLLDDYRDNFLRGGSWHLLWPLLALTVALLLRLGERRRAGVVCACLGSCALATVFIFQFTENGAWAEDWSAINRLPLQLSPLFALVLAAAVATIVRSLRGASVAVALALAAAGVGACTAAFFWQADQASEAESGASNTFAASELTAMMGGVEATPDGSVAYTDFQDGVIVLASGPISHAADSASLITVKSRGDNKEALTFFWRNSIQPQALHTVFIDDRGEVTLALNDEPGWEDTILEIGITAFDDGGSLELEAMTLHPNDAAAQRKKAISDWLTPNSWSQRSVNWVDVGAAGSRISLPSTLLIGVLICGVLCLLAPSAAIRANATVAALMFAAIAWMALDARWVRSQAVMANRTMDSYPLLSAEALDFGGDKRIKDIVERYRGALEAASESATVANPDRPIVLIGSEDPAYVFQRLRARYHLLPEAALDAANASVAKSAAAEFAILIKSAFREQSDTATLSTQWLQGLSGSPWQVEQEDSEGVLLMRRPPS